MNAFNEFGKPIPEIEDFAYKLEQMIAEKLREMIAQGYSATDIRATSSYLAGCVQLAESLSVIELGRKLRLKKIADSDHNLNENESALVVEFSHKGLLQAKVDAIKAYRDRTGLGLKESKDAIEAYLAQYKIDYSNV